MAAQLTLVREHMLRFIQSKGSCSHFHRLPVNMMEETIHLIKSIGTYNEQYKEWIKANEKNSERFLKEA
jgi:hypothetical protein|tara:strand:+ start:227 stop:433 length:207 start_codon:yes stop_codon:yes gene_type:complete